MPNLIPSAMDVLKQFRAVFNAIKQHFQQVENICRISGAQLWALTVVVRQPGLRVSDLAKSMAIHQSTASNLVERLVELKMLKKTRSEQDQRVVHLSATSEGVMLIGKAPQPFEGALPEALRQMDPEDLDQLHALLGKLITILHASENDGSSPLAEITASPLTTSQ
ncbi:MAG: MarR family transcriptional regulator [Zoogloeaceae bacterium]|jgi:DNA-binding MarR family transcriptional regulator|nr:MarR family transcriptional regulator [Zoogloeaceae bacterium]